MICSNYLRGSCKITGILYPFFLYKALLGLKLHLMAHTDSMITYDHIQDELTAKREGNRLPASYSKLDLILYILEGSLIMLMMATMFFMV